MNFGTLLCMVTLVICVGPISMLSMWLFNDGNVPLAIAIISFFVMFVAFLFFSFTGKKTQTDQLSDEQRAAIREVLHQHTVLASRRRSQSQVSNLIGD